MFFNARSLLVVSFVSSLSYEVAARALELKPIHIEDITPDTVSKRTTPEGITLLPISDPGVLTHGQTLKREEPGNGCFDPHSSNNFFWGAYSELVSVIFFK
jgi:hypothetical protein